MNPAIEFLKPEINDRLTVYKLDADARVVLRSLLPVVIREARNAARLNFERLIHHRLDVAYLVAPHLDRLIEVESRHFEVLFAAEFNDDYVHSLNDAFAVESDASIGARARNAVGQRLLEPLLQEIGRKNRWSAARTARQCTIVASALSFDLNNAVALEQRHNRRQIQKRHDELGGVIMDIQEAVLSMAGSVRRTATEIAARAGSARADAGTAELEASATKTRADESRRRAHATAGATGKIDETIAQISMGTTKTVEVIAKSIAQASEINSSVEHLVTITNQIGSVVSLITHIAHQTNLLALNATIEASRAGDKGRGFSVVASEVKTLANRTAGATSEIAVQIQLVQDAVSRVASGVGAIVSTIRDVDGCAQGISAAIGQQQTVVRSIAEDAAAVMQASSGLVDSAECVTRAVQQTANTADQLEALSGALVCESGQVNETLDALLEQLRAA